MVSVSAEASPTYCPNVDASSMVPNLRHHAAGRVGARCLIRWRKQACFAASFSLSEAVAYRPNALPSMTMAARRSGGSDCPCESFHGGGSAFGIMSLTQPARRDLVKPAVGRCARVEGARGSIVVFQRSFEDALPSAPIFNVRNAVCRMQIQVVSLAYI